MAVGDAEAFDGAVEGEDIGKVTVIEPKARCGDEYGPVRGVGCGCEVKVEEAEEEYRETQEVGELHRGRRIGREE